MKKPTDQLMKSHNSPKCCCRDKVRKGNKIHREAKVTQRDTTKGDVIENPRQRKLLILQKLPLILHSIASRMYKWGHSLSFSNSLLYSEA